MDRHSFGCGLFFARSLLTLPLLAGLASCASSPSPAPELAVAGTTIERAERAGATQYAAQPLDEARHKLDAAQQAAQQDDSEKARELAAEADASGRLAEVQTQAALAEKSASELHKTVRTLERPPFGGQGASGAPQPLPRAAGGQ